MANAKVGKVAKAKVVEKVDTSITEVVTPSVPTPQTINGKQIVRTELLPSGRYSVLDVEGTMYTLPATEFLSLE